MSFSSRRFARRFPGGVVPVVVALLGAGTACNDVLGIGEPIPLSATGSGGEAATTTSGGTGGAAGGTGGAATTGGGGTGGSATTSTSCPTTVKTLVAKEDACLFPGSCNGSISLGNSTYANLGFGRCVLRFVVPAEVAAAFENDLVTSLDLTISREYGCGSDCNLMTPGPFEARPVRNDWIEGNGQSYGGLDYCRRTKGNPGDPWDKPGAEGALDVPPGDPSGTVTVENTDESFVIHLDPVKHKDWIGTALDGQTSLSVRVMRPEGTTTLFIMSTHEGADPSRIAQLTVTYCQ